MTKEEWVAERIQRMNELEFLQGVNELQKEWIVDMFNLAWDRGYAEGSDEAFERFRTRI